MASNLFLLKGWTITLIAALFALAARDSDKAYFIIAYLPAFMFWMLDGYFLSQERAFRALYDHVRKLREDQIDFSMDTTPFRTDSYVSWGRAMFSKTLFFYYLGLIVTMVVVMLIMG
jgi:hypothetical protein